MGLHCHPRRGHPVLLGLWLNSLAYNELRSDFCNSICCSFFPLPVHPATYLPIQQCIPICIYPFIIPSIQASTSISVHPSTHPPACLSIHQPAYPSLPIHPFIYPSVQSPFHQPRQPAHLSIHHPAFTDYLPCTRPRLSFSGSDRWFCVVKAQERQEHEGSG